MPNWCNNKLTIRHKDAQVIADLHETICNDDDSGLFQHIKPMPENIFRGLLGNEEREECERKGIPNWYDWCCENWGTKWEACHLIEYQEDAHTLQLSFDTAWSPPDPIFQALTEKGFEVEAYYVEYGMGFAGEYHSDADGNVTEEFSDNIDTHIPANVDEVFDISMTLAEWAEEEKEYA